MIADIARKIKRLFTYTKTSRKPLAVGVVASAAAQFLALWMMAGLLGDSTAAIQRSDMRGLWLAVGVAVPWLAAVIALNALSEWCIGVTTARTTVSLRGHLLGTMLDTSLKTSQTSHSGVKLSYFTNDVMASMDSLITSLIKPVSAVLVGIPSLLYVLSVHWSIAVIALVIGGFTFAYSMFFAKRLHAIAVRMQALLAVLESRMKDLLDGTVVARMFGLQRKLEGDMDDSSQELMKKGIQWARLSGALGAVNNAVSYFSDKALIFAAGWLFLADLLSIPELLRVSEMAGGVIGVFHISRMLVAVQRSLAGAERIFSVIDGTKPEAEGEATCGGVPDPVLTFDGVTFGYSAGQQVLKNISFDVRAGELVAFVGPSGCGKSTILRLAQGLYAPDQGRVAFQDVAVEAWDRKALRDSMVLVPQEPLLFPGTVAENIAIGRDAPSGERVEWAARMACAHDFIQAMPNGYETPVTERGASLSGGQKQRIAIARALYRDAQVLLLDEATSAMDAETEAAIHTMLAGLKGTKTILYVTHRSSALNIADRVLRV